MGSTIGEAQKPPHLYTRKTSVEGELVPAQSSGGQLRASFKRRGYLTTHLSEIRKRGVLAVCTGDFNLRWFTPGVEDDLCGHATLASAYVLALRKHNVWPVRFHTLQRHVDRRSGPRRLSRWELPLRSINI